LSETSGVVADDAKMAIVGVQGELIGRRREQETLAQLIDDLRHGNSGALVIRGEPGIGKTALISNALAGATEVRQISISGVEYESELAYASLQLICQPLLDHIEDLPPPQRNALLVVLGRSVGGPPDRFRVALAVLTLLSEAARVGPIACVIDDAQWVDRASLQALAFVARRLAADPVLMVFASRSSSSEDALTGLPELGLGPLEDGAARELLARSLPGLVDEQAQDGILGEAGGNPLALLELHRVLTPAELAGGYGLASARLPAERVESVFSALLPGLPESTRTLLLIAALEPAGEPADVWAAAGLLGVAVDAADPAEAAGLLRVGRRIRFRHPLVRSAVYQSAPATARRQAHQALAEVMTAPGTEARRAWHRAHAACRPDESVARDLETAAEQARTRGGVAAAAAFLAAAVGLTPSPEGRGRRAVAAARYMLDAGAPDTAVELLAHTEGATDVDATQVEMLRAEIAFATRRGGDAPVQLLACAERLRPVDTALSRQTYLKAMLTSIFAARFSDSDAADPAAVAAGCASAPAATEPPTAPDLRLDGLVRRFSTGYRDAAPVLQQALRVFYDEATAGEADMQWYGLAGRVALDLWDQEAWTGIAQSQVDLLRRGGVLTLLPVALAHRAGVSVHCGRFAEADGFIEEGQAISAAIGTPPPDYIEPVLAAFRGQRELTMNLVRASIASGMARGEGRVIPLVGYAAAVLHNTFGEYRDALEATEWAVDYDDLGMCGYGLVERVEAAALGGDPVVAREALAQLLERTAASGTDMALGMAARSQALLADGERADSLFTESIEYLQRCNVDVLLARVRLLYGEWLHAMGRREAAAIQLRRAHGTFAAARAEAFAARARRGLSGLGQAVPTPDTGLTDRLSRQELTIARLARGGYTNTEIAAQLFLSPRTVEWHMTKVLGKLNIASRRELRLALAETG
jgi:DNA-binding CsgD family transcriptional regulator